MHYWLEYLRERIKWRLSKCFKTIIGRLRTPMDYVIMELKFKGYLAEDSEALELFGMYGLWHTMYYLPDVKHVDFFDIQEYYIRCAKRNFKNYLDKVDLYCADSIKYINETEKKYDMVVADTPFGVDQFFDENGLPTFFDSMLKVLKKRGILIFNIHTSNVIRWDLIKEHLEKMTGERRIIDIAVIPRNTTASYIVLVIE